MSKDLKKVSPTIFNSLLCVEAAASVNGTLEVVLEIGDARTRVAEAARLVRSLERFLSGRRRLVFLGASSGGRRNHSAAAALRHRAGEVALSNSSPHPRHLLLVPGRETTRTSRTISRAFPA